MTLGAINWSLTYPFRSKDIGYTSQYKAICICACMDMPVSVHVCMHVRVGACGQVCVVSMHGCCFVKFYI